MKSAFTLIEMSIVLVVIGLIVGGVLVGRDLIRAAAVRATISQIEKYNTAANTFYGKYGYLPGDIPAGPASQFGFTARGASTCGGEGDGNGIIAGVSPANGCEIGGTLQNGEPLMFWVDLSTANLIDGTFNTATPYPLATNITAITTPSLSAYFPTAKLGQGNYVVVYSGGISAAFGWSSAGDGHNYYSVTGISSLSLSQDWSTINPPIMGLTVAQANAIDSKIDDGLPQTGNVLATGPWATHTCAAGEGYCFSLLSTGATPGSPTTCFDNGNTASAAQQYSLKQNGGAGVNCALSFKFQ